MSCRYCHGTGVYKQPNDPDKFNELIDREMDKAYYVNYVMAEEKAYNQVGFTEVACPYCSKNSSC